ncbi:MAG: hypothetical protein JWO06_1391, partial [Bacteroidota bacterium]|nr:hypothetical protein [Bacteroidota bacterium]
MAFLVSLIPVSCNTQISRPEKNEKTEMPVIQNEEVVKSALKHLYENILSKGHGTKVVLNQNEIVFGDTIVRLNVNVEFDGMRDNQWIYAANFVTTYKANFEESVAIGSIGIGNTKDEAIQASVEEWYAMFGIPFSDLLRGTSNSATSDVKIFPSMMATRGVVSPAWVKEAGGMNDKITPRIRDEAMTL